MHHKTIPGTRHDHDHSDHDHSDHDHSGHDHSGHNHSGHNHPAHDQSGHDAGHADDHSHEHPGGLKGLLMSVFRPHSHDSADFFDSELEGSAHGIRAVKISLVALGTTALLQLAVVASADRSHCWPTPCTTSQMP